MTITDEMIEHAARAMHKITVEPLKFTWEQLHDDDKAEYRLIARAALEAAYRLITHAALEAALSRKEQADD